MLLLVGGQSPESFEGIYTLANGDLQKIEPSLPLAARIWDSKSNELIGIDTDYTDPLTSKEQKMSWLRYSLTTKKIIEEKKFTTPIWAHPILSPNKRLILFANAHSNNLCSGSGQEVLSLEIGVDTAPKPFSSNMCNTAWSFDGTKLAYTLSDGLESRVIMIADADGRNPQRLFNLPNPLPTSSVAWSPDGTQIAFTYGRGHNAIYVIDVPPHLR
jgi:WD40 repeat protein